MALCFILKFNSTSYRYQLYLDDDDVTFSLQAFYANIYNSNRNVMLLKRIQYDLRRHIEFTADSRTVIGR